MENSEVPEEIEQVPENHKNKRGKKGRELTYESHQRQSQFIK